MSSPTEMQIVRTFEAPIESVYRAFTVPKELERWIWGVDAKGIEAEVDLRVGGAWSVYIDNPWHEKDGRARAGMLGLVATHEPHQRFAYTLHWDSDVVYNRGDAVVPDEFVDVIFEPDGEGTRVTFRHMGIPDDGHAAPEHKRAVESTFDVLAALLSA